MPYAYPTSAMKKSSVYLPDELKADLARLSARWGRSEADLIRLAIERLVRSSEEGSAPARPARAPTGPRLIGVGIGPGDPDLVTARSLAVLHGADRVVAASTGPDAISRAEAAARAAAPEVRVDRLVIQIGGDDGDRDRSIRAGADELVAHLDQGEVVALVVLGDPNVYSVFTRISALVRAARPDVPIESIPGVMAFQALAASTGTALVSPGEQMAVVALGDDATPLEPLLDDPQRTVVVYKGGRHLPAVAEMLHARGRAAGAVVGELLGLPGGRAVPVEDVADRPASYLATVVVPSVRSEGEAS